MIRRLVPLLLVSALFLGSCSQQAESSVKAFPLLGSPSGPMFLVAGPNGVLWVFEQFQGKLARIVVSGTIKEFALPLQASVGQLAVGLDGTLWFTEPGENKLGYLDPRGHLGEVVFAPVDDSTRAQSPLYRGLAVDPDGNLWFTDSDNLVIRRLAPGGTVTTFPVTSSAGSPDRVVAAGGALWISFLSHRTISRLDLRHQRVDFPLPWAQALMTPGPTGGVWFAGQSSPVVGYLTPTGGIKTFSFPQLQAGCVALATGPGSILWCSLGNSLAAISPQGRLTTYPLPAGVEAQELVAGSDGTLWFTDPTRGRIWRWQPPVDLAAWL